MKSNKWEKWLEKNSYTLEMTQRQVENRHNFLENLRIALTNHNLPEIDYVRPGPDFYTASGGEG